MSNRKYSIDTNICEFWTAELAYLIGYALTDGTVNKQLTCVVVQNVK